MFPMEHFLTHTHKINHHKVAAAIQHRDTFPTLPQQRLGHRVPFFKRKIGKREKRKSVPPLHHFRWQIRIRMEGDLRVGNAHFFERFRAFRFVNSFPVSPLRTRVDQVTDGRLARLLTLWFWSRSPISMRET